MFEPHVYAQRRHQLIQDLRQKQVDGLLLFLGNQESPANYPDNGYPFRQDSSFLYFFGVDLPEYAALIDLESGSSVIFADDLGVDAIVWTGPQPSVASWAERCGATGSAQASALASEVARARSQGRVVHFLPPYRAENRLRLQMLLGLTQAPSADQASLPLIQAVVALRSVKDPLEIAEIEAAVDITVDMHLAAMGMLRPGMRESEIAAKVTQIALAQGSGVSFPVIATVHGETLHNHFHGNVARSGEMFLLDCGAESLRHYAGDLSSSFPVDPEFTSPQRDIYAIVLRAHLAAIETAKPGVPMREVHRTACRQIAEGLKELGLMKGDCAEAVEAGAHALFFPCGTGHMMGLDVHDMEDLGELWVGHEGAPRSTQFGLKSLRLARPLQPGFVITIEPGIYFIPELIRRWEAENRFEAFINYEAVRGWVGTGGMRIEEDLLIQETDSRILGKWRPRTWEEVETVRKG